MIELICEKTQNLKQFADENCAQASFCFAWLLKNKEIKVNGKKVGENVQLNAGDTVQFYLTQKQSEKPAFYVVYEDEHLLIVDKESGVNAEATFAELRRTYGNDCAFIHRLDRNTRGLMAFARSALAERELLSAFKEKRVEKRYLARCFGFFAKPQDTLVAYLKKNADTALVRIYDTPVADSEKIITQYRVLKQEEKESVVEVILHTGKTHQIRAHLAHIGNPIVGDMKYGDNAKNRERNITRQCLVAKYLCFSFTGELGYLSGKTFVSRFDV